MRDVNALAEWTVSVGLAKERQQTATDVAGDETKFVAVHPRGAEDLADEKYRELTWTFVLLDFARIGIFPN